MSEPCCPANEAGEYCTCPPGRMTEEEADDRNDRDHIEMLIDKHGGFGGGGC